MSQSRAEIQAEIEGHNRRNEVLVAELMKRGVGPDDRLRADLHFWMPSPEAAHALGAALRPRGFVRIEVGRPRPDEGLTSLTVVVEETVANIVSKPYVEFLVRAASDFGGTHDGWGASASALSRPTSASG